MCYANCPYEDFYGDCKIPRICINYPKDAFCERDLYDDDDIYVQNLNGEERREQIKGGNNAPDR